MAGRLEFTVVVLVVSAFVREGGRVTCRRLTDGHTRLTICTGEMVCLDCFSLAVWGILEALLADTHCPPEEEEHNVNIYSRTSGAPVMVLIANNMQHDYSYSLIVIYTFQSC